MNINDSLFLFPVGAETVKQVRKDASNAVMWVDNVGNFIKSGQKFSLTEAKAKLDAANRLKITCPEYNDLKKSFNAAKKWSKSVKKCGLDEGSAQIYAVKDLIQEHNSFLISMPDELEALKQALCAYCICRRPYEGFMIGCDDCEEWYHGPCIGVSQAQGDRIDKYLCVRCCVKKMYWNSCNSVASIIKKWIDPMEMAKSRTLDAQKHQRKIREKKREINKLKEELEEHMARLAELKMVEAQRLSLNSSSTLMTSEIHLAQSTPDTLQTNQESTDDNPLCQKIAEINATIVKKTTLLGQNNRRMEELYAMGNKRKVTQMNEDSLKNSFIYWCLLLRNRVLSPETIEDAEKSRPKPSLSSKTGSEILSSPMVEVLDCASKYGIEKFPDIIAVKNHLESISWCHFAFNVLRKKPKIEEVKTLIDLSTEIKLPEVKSIGMLRSMISRTTPWQVKANKVLAPTPGASTPISIESLNELQLSLNSVPLTSPEEILLCQTVKDVGSRHCSCGGPLDATTMDCCVHCESWFHFSCYSLDVGQCSEITCPVCSKPFQAKAKSSVQHPIDDNISSHAPDPLTMWPPYGLGSSEGAGKAFGYMRSSLQNLMEPTHPEDNEVRIEPVSFNGAKSHAKAQTASNFSPFDNDAIMKQTNMNSSSDTNGITLKLANDTAHHPSNSSPNDDVTKLSAVPPQPWFGINGFAKTEKRPLGIDSLNIHSASSNSAYLTNSHSLIKSTNVNQESADGVKLALSASSIPPMIDNCDLIDAKAAAEVAALANFFSNNDAATSNMINGCTTSVATPNDAYKPFTCAPEATSSMVRLHNIRHNL